MLMGVKFDLQLLSGRHPQLNPILNQYFAAANLTVKNTDEKTTEDEFQHLMAIPRGLSFIHRHELDGDGWYEVRPDIEPALTIASQYVTAENCIRRLKDYEKLSSANRLALALLIAASNYPASSVEFEKLDGDTLCLILVNRPSLKDHCDFSKFSGRDWAVLLSENPAFEDLCDWTKFDESDWTYLLNDRPWMADKRPLG